MKMIHKRKIMDGEDMDRTLKRISTEIVERMPDSGDVMLIGIQTRGVPLAKRIHRMIPGANFGILDITFYRDDLTLVASNPVVHKTEIPGNLEEKKVVLIDDVLFTGRTVRAAIDNILDYGRPASIRLAVLVDRGHRELPVQADFVGRIVPTAISEFVEVKVREVDEEDSVWLMERGNDET